jgi:gliding motility-associated lipoprotein GldH
MRKMMLFVGMLLLGVLAACNPNRIYDEYQELPGMQWSKKQPLKFEVNVQDASKTYQLGISLRHNTSIRYGDLLFTLQRTAPSGEKISLQYVMPVRDKTSQQLLGEAMGDICDTGAVIESALQFTEVGMYVFELVPAMEEDPLVDIMEAGIFIEAAEAKK